MEIKKSYRPGYNFKLLFKGLDIPVMVAAARERMYKLAETEDAESSSIADVEIAKWNSTRKVRKLSVVDLTSTADDLEEFGKDTSYQIEDIPEHTRLPIYENPYIARRVELGRHALLLANQLRDKEINQVSTDEIDEEFAKLLGDAQAPPE